MEYLSPERPLAASGDLIGRIKMRRTLALLTLLLLSNSCVAQWRKIADFNGEYITCVYFLDLPGPPRIGFVGTESELYKTTNGGNSWRSVWDSGGSYSLYDVSGICFKESLTGWFSIFGDTDACYRTTDGGATWTELQVPGSTYGAQAIAYVPETNRLFLSVANDSPMKVSTDLGNTWQFAAPYSTFGFSFSSPLQGIVSAWFDADSMGGYLTTADGGMRWDSVKTTTDCNQPLAILGTPICFSEDLERVVIRRSDDYGQTWRVLKDFGPVQDSQFNFIAPYGWGVICGELSRLYFQTDSGMYLSTDEGVTWRNDGGPPCDDGGRPTGFYSSKGVTVAGMTYDDNGVLADGGLWEEDTAEAGVAKQEPSSSILRIFPNPAANNITVAPTTGTILILDPLGRSYSVPKNGNTLDISSLPSGVYFVSDGVSPTKFVKE